MHPPYRVQVQLWPARYDETWFEALFLALDRLHDTVSARRMGAVSTVAPAEIVGWLQDIIYTAQETIAEIRATQPGSHVTEMEQLS